MLYTNALLRLSNNIAATNAINTKNIVILNIQRFADRSFISFSSKKLICPYYITVRNFAKLKSEMRDFL